jgi:hypothetical protein
MNCVDTTGSYLYQPKEKRTGRKHVSLDFLNTGMRFNLAVEAHGARSLLKTTAEARCMDIHEVHMRKKKDALELLGFAGVVLVLVVSSMMSTYSIQNYLSHSTCRSSSLAS